MYDLGDDFYDALPIEKSYNKVCIFIMAGVLDICAEVNYSFILLGKFFRRL